MDERVKLLIVDDDQIVATTLARIFDKRGYGVRIAQSAEDALVAVRDWHPSAAIVEVHLPGMGGGALARLLRLACPDCRVTLMAGRPIDEDMFVHMVGDFPLVAKPIEPEKLLAFVSESLLGG